MWAALRQRVKIGIVIPLIDAKWEVRYRRSPRTFEIRIGAAPAASRPKARPWLDSGRLRDFAGPRKRECRCGTGTWLVDLGFAPVPEPAAFGLAASIALILICWRQGAPLSEPINPTRCGGHDSKQLSTARGWCSAMGGFTLMRCRNTRSLFSRRAPAGTRDGGKRRKDERRCTTSRTA